MVPLFLIFCNDRGSGFLGINASDEVQAKFEVVKSEEEWKKILPTDAYYVLRKKGTERAFTGTYHDNKEKGIYVCAACGNELFSSEAKFDSGTGWPSFFTPVSEQKIGTETDSSWGMKRTEVHCARCGGHLGHVFEDGPAPTGLRYCMNSVSLKFLPSKK
ncbi:MAG: peptide-methionine (R)-S-oxide reductase MsrB [Leptospira sp.]|nr:peptide-methionine (R)-S-oxide reductase MsrB [Leptospira sp.]